MTATPPRGVAKRRRWAIRLLVRSLVAPSTVTDDERAAVGAWLSSVARGGELKRFDLRHEIEIKGFTVRTFAAKIGVSWRLVYYWAAHERLPSLDMARRIADGLGIPMARVVARYPIRRLTTQKFAVAYDPKLPLLGNNLRAARLRCGLKQAELVALAGVRSIDIAAAESPYKSPPSGRALKDIQRVVTERLEEVARREAEKPVRRRGRPRKDGR